MIGCLRECKLIVISLVFHNFNKHKANIRTLNRTKVMFNHCIKSRKVTEADNDKCTLGIS